MNTPNDNPSDGVGDVISETDWRKHPAYCAGCDDLPCSTYCRDPYWCKHCREDPCVVGADCPANAVDVSPPEPTVEPVAVDVHPLVAEGLEDNEAAWPKAEAEWGEDWRTWPGACEGCANWPCQGSCASPSWCKVCGADPCGGWGENCAPEARAEYLAEQEMQREKRAAAERQKNMKQWSAAREQRAAEIEAEEIAAKLDTLRPRPRSSLVPDELPTLARLFALPKDPQPFRIEGLWRKGSSVLFGAGPKTGKTRRRNEVVKCLADGGKLFGEFEVVQLAPGEAVTVFDFELDEALSAEWFEVLEIENTDCVRPVHLKGRVASFDIRKPEVRAKWAKLLRDANTKTAIMDCLAPVLAGLEIHENSPQVGEFLNAWDTLMVDAGVSENMIVHHFGHNGEFRGHSSLIGWGGFLWRLTRRSPRDPQSPRYFEVEGRARGNESVPKGRLGFDPLTGLSTYAPAAGKLSTGVEAPQTLPGEVDAVRVDEDIAKAVRKFVKDNPRCSQRAIETGVKGRADNIRAAIKRLVDEGKISRVDGNRGSEHTLIEQTA